MWAGSQPVHAIGYHDLSPFNFFLKENFSPFLLITVTEAISRLMNKEMSAQVESNFTKKTMVENENEMAQSSEGEKR